MTNTDFISRSLADALQQGHCISGRVTRGGKRCWFGVEKKPHIAPGCPVVTPIVEKWFELGEVIAHRKAAGLSAINKLKRTAADLIERAGTKGTVARWTTIKIELF